MTTGTVVRKMYTMYKGLLDDLGESGCDTTLSKSMGYSVQAHHCISCSVMAEHQGGKLAKLAEDSGYDINTASNGIALPAYFGHSRKDNLQRHRGGHWQTYYDYVDKKLAGVYKEYKNADPCNDPEDAADILGALQAVESDIHAKLKNRKLWLYDWSEDLWNADYRDEGTGNMNSGRNREGSSAAGSQWIVDFPAASHRRRHTVSGSKKSVRNAWYASYGYPVPGSTTS
jgi:hypothetical protein